MHKNAQKYEGKNLPQNSLQLHLAINSMVKIGCLYDAFSEIFEPVSKPSRSSITAAKR